jgi:molybdate transport system ATP-binding protein
MKLQFSIQQTGTSYDGLNWELSKNEHWYVLGYAMSQNISLEKWLSEPKASPLQVQLTPPIRLPEEAFITRKREQHLIDREKKNDDSEFVEGGFDPGTSVETFLHDTLRKYEHQWPNTTGHKIRWQKAFQHIWNTGLRFLSNGEFKKVMLAAAQASKSPIVLLESPFDGLDMESKTHLQNTLATWGNGSTIILTHSAKDIPREATGVIILREGKPPEVIRSTEPSWTDVITSCHAAVQHSHQKKVVPDELLSMNEQLIQRQQRWNQPVVIKNLNISFSDRAIFSGLQWTIDQGEHWNLHGPNGAGKTTLLNLIHADLPQAYGQDVTLFGFKRGTGESIWDIRQHIGFLGTDYQRQFPKTMNGLAAVLSGYFDTMGLFKKPSPSQINLAKVWAKHLGISLLMEKYLTEMTYGEVRIMLMLRAMIKCPALLILDEPCQGMPEEQSRDMLETLEHMLENTATQLIFVSHEQQHLPKRINKRLSLKPNEQGISCGQIEQI